MKLLMEKAVYGGASLARLSDDAGASLAGKAVFVAGALPGEQIEATVASERRGYITGTLQAVLEPSPVRIEPECEYYERCGGCHYQHAEYSAQLEMKQAILREAFARAHLQPPDTIHAIPSQPWGYRNRIRMHVARRPRPTLAYRETASHCDLAVAHCPVAAPLLQQALASFNRLLDSDPKLASELTEVELFTNADETSLLVTLFLGTRTDARRLLLKAFDSLHRDLPLLRGISAFLLDSRTRRTEPLGATGAANLEYRVGTLRYQVSAGAFFQVNRFLIPALLHAVTAEHRGSLAWDLYAGVGLFAQALAANFEQVVAVESAPASSADLARNLAGKSHRLVLKETLRFLQQPAAGQPDLVIVDPPRAGLGAEVTARLAAVGPSKIVYVSCDPSTLARDLKMLQASGYRPQTVTLLDLFPQTFHMETVAVLARD